MQRKITERRERDSNPRFPFRNTRFPGVPDKPLLHLSKNGSANKSNKASACNFGQQLNNLINKPERSNLSKMCLFRCIRVIFCINGRILLGNWP
jgi:hypothetical protein